MIQFSEIPRTWARVMVLLGILSFAPFITSVGSFLDQVIVNPQITSDMIFKFVIMSFMLLIIPHIIGSILIITGLLYVRSYRF